MKIHIYIYYTPLSQFFIATYKYYVEQNLYLYKPRYNRYVLLLSKYAFCCKLGIYLNTKWLRYVSCGFYLNIGLKHTQKSLRIIDQKLLERCQYNIYDDIIVFVHLVVKYNKTDFQMIMLFG